MTPRVWIERPIESVEDAESLPEGTVAHRVLQFESVTTTLTQPEVAVKVGLNAWDSTAVEAIDKDWLNAHMIGWTALAPVEAVEEMWPAEVHLGTLTDLAESSLRTADLAAARGDKEWESDARFVAREAIEHRDAQYPEEADR